MASHLKASRTARREELQTLKRCCYKQELRFTYPFLSALGAREGLPALLALQLAVITSILGA